MPKVRCPQPRDRNYRVFLCLMLGLPCRDKRTDAELEALAEQMGYITIEETEKQLTL